MKLENFKLIAHGNFEYDYYREINGYVVYVVTNTNLYTNEINHTVTPNMVERISVDGVHLEGFEAFKMLRFIMEIAK